MDQLKQQLFCDGGVIGRNPSTQGGTWAFRLVEGETVLLERSGIITPTQAHVPSVTNNLTEMAAVLYGLMTMSPGWSGVVLSDSRVTLGRVFQGWKWNNIPAWMTMHYSLIRQTMFNWPEITWVLLDGHPTRAQLDAGIGKRGHPVSVHNAWCDSACGARAKAFLASAAVTVPQPAQPAGVL